jgi:hypothetical protein
MKRYLSAASFILIFYLSLHGQSGDATLWHKYEITFKSVSEYENPLQDVKSFQITFHSPTGRNKTINGFWDGSAVWKARFMPDEEGLWTFETVCSDRGNSGLHGQKGEFRCNRGKNENGFYRNGPIIRQPGRYHLSYADGTPFFYMACTAWNGALKSTDDEWDQYLKHRVDNNYNVIQYVTTQWRGCDKNSLGEVAFEGSGRIRINPEFFRLIDKKTDRINDFGLVAAPVILWTLQTGAGRELSPGYYLPDDQAVLLARYIVARYGGNHVIWILGGDGNYTGPYEQRWKTIGRAVFDGTHQGIVAQHPQGRSWIGEVYKDEKWIDIIGYQSSHSNQAATVDWINKGPMSKEWANLPARPLINLEPNYEQIGFRITDRDVRNACYWSLFATPVAGITYGANGIWPWLRPGERILNHSDAPGTSPWYESIKFPGSVQMGYLAGFFAGFEWWNLFPANQLLTEQPGDKEYNKFVSVLKSSDGKTILIYIPGRMQINLRKPLKTGYAARWFNPATNKYTDGVISDNGQLISAGSPEESDLVLVLRAK